MTIMERMFPPFSEFENWGDQLVEKIIGHFQKKYPFVAIKDLESWLANRGESADKAIKRHLSLTHSLGEGEHKKLLDIIPPPADVTASLSAEELLTPEEEIKLRQEVLDDYINSPQDKDPSLPEESPFIQQLWNDASRLIAQLNQLILSSAGYHESEKIEERELSQFFPQVEEDSNGKKWYRLTIEDKVYVVRGEKNGEITDFLLSQPPLLKLFLADAIQDKQDELWRLLQQSVDYYATLKLEKAAEEARKINPLVAEILFDKMIREAKKRKNFYLIFILRQPSSPNDPSSTQAISFQVKQKDKEMLEISFTKSGENFQYIIKVKNKSVVIGSKDNDQFSPFFIYPIAEWEVSPSNYYNYQHLQNPVAQLFLRARVLEPSKMIKIDETVEEVCRKALPQMQQASSLGEFLSILNQFTTPQVEYLFNLKENFPYQLDL